MRSRILTSILLVALVGMTVAGLTAFLVQRDRIVTQIDDMLLANVESARFVVTGESDPVTTDSEQGEPPGGVAFTTSAEALEAILARVIPGRHESALGIVDGEATLVPGVDIAFHLEDDPGFVQRIVDETSDGGVHLGTAISSVGTVRYVATPIVVQGDPQSAVYVAAVDVDAELDELRAAFGTYTIVASVTLVAIGLVGWFVAGRLLRPLRRLRVAASRITASERGERIPVVGHDDISALTETVNGMLGRLDRAMTTQRQLLDDVRHELKTPITILRGHLELLEASNVDDVESTRALAIDELDRMTRLVDDIESLAEAQRMTLARTPTDVADLTSEVFAKASVIPDHDWALAGVAHVSTSLDPGRITQAMLQLVDNAAKYSPPGTPIEIGSTADGSTVEFWVADRGRGIPAGAEDRIFDRFGRADTGRGIEGSGLGLPIVKTIAMAHGGRVSLTSSSTGSRFGIVIPLPDAPQTEEDEDS
ncbi:HAMP domain-containing sensor histidine kinase [Conyzicola nivalis]|uniref:histidine kinase n=1 Tax=Conyzicola nivalis TaxID=1477021 RepID=A0A916SJ76_9MICO|nr:two-component sensor histidine kinase [Conyzicola nivalis]